MSGLAGESIGLGTAGNLSIAPAKALTDASTAGKGCVENFIGFGLAVESTPQAEDFNATDDTVTLGITGGSSYEPTYTDGVLTWEIPA